MIRSIATTVVVLAAGFAALLVMVWATQRRLIYFPSGAVPAGIALAETVTFTAADGIVLAGWFLPAPRPPASFTVVVFNGNAGNRAYRLPLAAALRQENVAVLLFDYRGYGGNQGAPTEEGLAADARAVRAALLRRPDVDPSRLVFFGESLGAAVAIRLAAEHPPAGLVLRSPFTSLADVGRVHYPLLPVGLLLRDRYPSLDRVAQIRCPVLVVAGARDRVVPPGQSRRLYDAIASPKTLAVLPGADHNDAALADGPELMAAVAGFLRRLP